MDTQATVWERATLTAATGRPAGPQQGPKESPRRAPALPLNPARTPAAPALAHREDTPGRTALASQSICALDPARVPAGSSSITAGVHGGHGQEIVMERVDCTGA